LTHRLFLIAVSTLCCTLLACSTPVRQDAQPRPERSTIRQFHLDGRIAITHAGESNTVRINWDHSQGKDLIGFSGPLGNRLAELRRDAAGAHWTTSSGESQDASDADALIADLTNLSLPLQKLAEWVVGRVGPEAVSVRDEHGRLLSATDEGWTIRFSRYENDTPNALPALLDVQGKGLRVKLAIEELQP
jgi:outer membrane lipoprotein LolB